jgi:cytochrome P450/NADPH-cytochrome P450 reductase
MPAFGPQTIRDMFADMTDISSQLILRWERFVGEEIGVCDNFTRLTLDTIAFYQKTIDRFVDATVNLLVESGGHARQF